MSPAPFYDDGPVTIYCADFRTVALEPGSVAAVITSPPDNIGLDYHTTPDAVPWPEYWSLAANAAAVMAGALVEGGRVWLNTAVSVPDAPCGGRPPSGRAGKARVMLAHRWATVLEAAGLVVVDQVAWCSPRGAGTAWGSWESPVAPEPAGRLGIAASRRPGWERIPPADAEDWRDTVGGWPALSSTVWKLTPARRDGHPAPMLRFGEQDDLQGLLGGTPEAERRVRYLCKYLNKEIAGTYDGGDDDMAPARAAHIDRLAEEVRWLPCASTCANWLRFGVQPKGAWPGMVPGHCKHEAHDRTNLGLGARRVLVSRQWSGKTLAGHKADRTAVVRPALEEAGMDPDDHDELSVSGTDGRWSWELLGRSRVDERTYAAAIAEQITTRQRWRAQYETAKATTAARAGPAPPAGRSSAIRSDSREERSHRWTTNL